MKFQQLASVGLFGASCMAITGCQTLSEFAPSASFLKGFSDGLSTGLGLGLPAGGGSNSSSAPASRLISTIPTCTGYAVNTTGVSAGAPANDRSSATPAAVADDDKCYLVRLHNPRAGGGLYEDVITGRGNAEQAIQICQWAYGGNRQDIRILREVPCR